MLLPSYLRRVFIAHTAEQLLFGPFCVAIPGSACSPREHKLLQGVDGIWSVSRTIQEYASRYGNLETTFLFHHPWNYLIGEDYELPRRRRNLGKGLVTMINPCPVKGSDILTKVARRCPDLNFLVLSSWGIDEHPQVRKDLEAIPNVT
jgi:hypothetical protein